MIISVISDTHIPRRAKSLPAQAYELIDSSDLVIHAGDLISAEFLEHLSSRKETFCVRGNNDEVQILPEYLELELEDVKFAVIHDAGSKKNRRERLRQQFPLARVIIYGHSHVHECSDENNLLLLNPGSPTDRRRQPYHTMAMVEVFKGEISAEIIMLK